MREVKGIKAFSIAAVFGNGSIVLLLLSAAIWQGATASNSDLIIFMPAMLGSLLSMVYPLLLLTLRRKYYQGRLIPSSARDITHITRIFQLMFTLVLVFFSARGIYNILLYRQKYFPKPDLAITAIIILLAVTAVINAVVFFKGWRLLRQTRKSYIDEVMAAFDDGEPSKQ